MMFLKRFSSTASSAFLVLLFPAALICAEEVKYGDIVFLQNSSMNNRWLSGGRGEGNASVITRDAKSNEYEFDQNGAFKHYQWELQSEPKKRGGVDPKDGTCVKYGDTIYLKAGGTSSRWLSGARAKAANEVLTRDFYSAESNQYESRQVGASYKWIVKSHPGVNGILPYTNQDDAHGICVEDLGTVFLQSAFTDSRWLSGARSSGNASVLTRDFYHSLNSSYESSNSVRPSYQWYVRKTFNSNGKRDDAASMCRSTGAKGAWAHVAYYPNADVTFKYTLEVTKGFEAYRGEAIEKGWSKSVISAVAAGFSFEIFGVGADLSAERQVTEEETGAFTSSVSRTIRSQEQQTTERTIQFENPGALWQFEMSTDVICSSGFEGSDSYNFPLDFLVSVADGKMPCCLPGRFVDDNNLHGPCHPGSPCLCDDDICNGTSGNNWWQELKLGDVHKHINRD